MSAKQARKDNNPKNTEGDSVKSLETTISPEKPERARVAGEKPELKGKEERPGESSPLETIRGTFIALHRYFSRAADKKYYNFFFRRSVVASIIFFITLGLFLDYLKQLRALEDNQPDSEQQLLEMSPRTLVVLNAVPRTTLAQKRVEVPVIKEVTFALDEVQIPRPNFGAIEVGPETSTDGQAGTGGSGKGSSRRPELLMLVPPVYPKEAQKKGLEGTVDLRVLVTEQGTVDKVEVTTSSGHSDMDRAAVDAAKRTRFRPAIRNGERVAMWINYPIQFALTNANRN